MNEIVRGNGVGAPVDPLVDAAVPPGAADPTFGSAAAAHASVLDKLPKRRARSPRGDGSAPEQAAPQMRLPGVIAPKLEGYDPQAPRRDPSPAEPPAEVRSRPTGRDAAFARGTADKVVFVPPLPRTPRPSTKGVSRAFVLVVVIPTFVVALYLYLFAANQYVAEFRFSVMQSAPILPGQAPPSSTSSAASSMVSGLSALVGGSSSLTGASAQNFLVVDYLVSRDAVSKLQTSIGLTDLYDRPQADWWSRYSTVRSANHFFPYWQAGDFLPYWQSMVYANYDQVTGLARVEVRAFTPRDALTIASGLYKLSEGLINDIANRPNLDVVTFADKEAKRARERLTADQEKLKAFRTKEQIIDPTQSVVPANVQQVNALEASLISLKTQLATLLNQKLSKDAPIARSLAAQIAAANSELQRVGREVAQQRGASGQVLTDVMGRYEKINLDIQYDQSMIVATEQALDQARANAAAQHLYLTPYVLPQLVTTSVYPKRLQDVVLTGLLFFSIWLAGVLVVRAVEDHAG